MCGHFSCGFKDFIKVSFKISSAFLAYGESSGGYGFGGGPDGFGGASGALGLTSSDPLAIAPSENGPLIELNLASGPPEGNSGAAGNDGGSLVSLVRLLSEPDGIGAGAVPGNDDGTNIGVVTDPGNDDGVNTDLELVADPPTAGVELDAPNTDPELVPPNVAELVPPNTDPALDLENVGDVSIAKADTVFDPKEGALVPNTCPKDGTN